MITLSALDSMNATSSALPLFTERCSAAPATALPEVVQKVAGRVPVLVDGGIRRGTDILRALALGATAVQVGRPVLWGLAAAGQPGVERVLRLLMEEFSLAMALAGCSRVSEISLDLIQPNP